MNFNNDEEALDFFNRLLDRLRQEGYEELWRQNPDCVGA